MKLDELKKIDPAVALETPSDQEWRAMFEGIVASRKRPKPLVTLAIAAAVGVGALLLGSAIAGDRVITIDAAEALADPSKLEQQLTEEGIEADIRSAPSNDLAGKWFHLYFEPQVEIEDETWWLLQSYVGNIHGGIEAVLERCPLGDCARTAELELPSSVEGPMTLVVGRTPRSGEEYWAKAIDWTNEIAPTGALYCHRLEERSPEEAQRILRGLGYEIVWVHDTELRSDEVDFPAPDEEITFAFFRGPNVIDVRTSVPADAEKFKIAGGTPSEAHPRSSVGWGPEC